MDFINYLVEDFVEDQSFVSYCLCKHQPDILFWEDWIRRHPEKLDTVMNAKQIVEMLALYPSDLETEMELKKVFAAGRLEKGNAQPKSFRKVKWAAAFLISIFIGGTYILVSSRISRPASSVASLSLEKKFSAMAGERKKLKLPDGSVVTLNSRSALTVSFSDALRLVELKGEAFFEVAKDTKKPFVVKTLEMTTRVIGTTFNVKSSDSAKVEVGLLEGKVLVNVENSSINLLAGEGVTYSEEKHTLLKESIDMKRTFAWKDGILYFKNEPFKIVVSRLEMWYGVQIHLVNYNDTLNVPFSGEFNNQSLKEVLTAMGFVKRFDFSIKKKEVIITFYQ